MTACADGSYLRNVSDDARCGAGVLFADKHPLNRVIRVLVQAQSNEVSELAAVVVALQSTPRKRRL